MDLTPANVRALRTTFNRDFRSAYDTTPVWYQLLATTVPSSSKQNDYGWMADLPNMREWLGPRVINNLVTHSYSLLNKTWEMSFGVPREDIEDDNLGVYSEVSAAHGEAARKHPDQLFVSLLQNGHTTLCFDGQYFFDTDHPVAPKDSTAGTYSNYVASGAALAAATYTTARTTMMSYKGDSTRPLGIMPNLLVVPPALEVTAKSIVEVQKNASGADNVLFGTASVMVVPELAGQDTTWYLLATQRRIKPFVFQSRRPLAFTAKNQREDEVVLVDNQLRFYADARYNAGYSLPFLAYKAAA
jgi:phage major head subunit gpT-like protein